MRALPFSSNDDVCRLNYELTDLRLPFLLQCDDITEGSQTEAEKARVCTNYNEPQLYVVTQNVTASQQMDLALVKGCVVAVIKESDPMGNRDRWFIDNGGLLMCFILWFLLLFHGEMETWKS